MTEITRNVDWRDRPAPCSVCGHTGHIYWMTLRGPLIYWCRSCLPREDYTIVTDRHPNTERVHARITEARCGRP
jgi:hypothetical protein